MTVPGRRNIKSIRSQFAKFIVYIFSPNLKSIGPFRNSGVAFVGFTQSMQTNHHQNPPANIDIDCIEVHHKCRQHIQTESNYI